MDGIDLHGEYSLFITFEHLEGHLKSMPRSTQERQNIGRGHLVVAQGYKELWFYWRRFKQNVRVCWHWLYRFSLWFQHTFQNSCAFPSGLSALSMRRRYDLIEHLLQPKWYFWRLPMLCFRASSKKCFGPLRNAYLCGLTSAFWVVGWGCTLQRRFPKLVADIGPTGVQPWIS